MWTTFYTPTSLEGALGLLSEHQANARLIAGGTDLIVDLMRGSNAPETVIDITGIPKLDLISLDELDQIHLGPLVTHNQVVGSKLCVDHAFPLAEACWQVGSPQIRNRGTIAGNIVTASPANDTTPPLRVLEASVTLQSVRGQRTLSLKDFHKGERHTALAVDEMVIDIFFPAMSNLHSACFQKLALRRAQAISLVNIAALLQLQEGLVEDARIALGSVAPTVVRAVDAEHFLIGKPLSQEVIDKAAELAASAGSPISDIRGTAEYRRYLTGVLTRNALQTLSVGTEREGWPTKPVMLWGKGDGHFSSRNHGGKVIKHSRDGNEPIVSTINGKTSTIYGANHKSLLRMLKEDVGLTGAKEGCGEGECGSCTLLFDGVAVTSCLVPAPQAHGHCIDTVEGLATGNSLHPVQQAFVDMGTVQCGYCIPGVVMSGVALMDEQDRPGLDEIKQALTGNFCRCTGYYPIMNALQRVSKTRESMQ
jgi:xanthine dehydrogenase iron-sulfur cluster and FAD-binding subunit A